MIKKAVLTTGGIFVIAGMLWIMLAMRYPTTLPYNALYYYYLRMNKPHSDLNKEIIGFLPYFRINDAQYIRHDQISEINYFALYFDAKGNIEKFHGDQTEPGWLNWQSEKLKNIAAQTQIMGNDFSLTIAVQKNKTIENILDNEKAQANMIQNILALAAEYNLDGINIDFEYLGEPDKKYRQKFADFIKNLRLKFNAVSEDKKIYLSVPPLAARADDLFDFKKLAPFTDKFIVMSYEYYSAGSDIAGPTAPMTGFEKNKYFFDVETTYDDYLKLLAKNKIIMGIPFYGRDWAVENITDKTLALGDPDNYSAVISYAYARDNKTIKSAECSWDETAAQKYCFYLDLENGVRHKVWLEDNKSLEIKFDFADKKDFAGIAIWALGFDKNYPDLWKMIGNKFVKK